MSVENVSSLPGEVHTGQRSRPFYIVGIGASAGGLESLESFFDHMPPDSGMAFVVVQHLSPDFKSLMDELLARHTKMPIHRVDDGVSVEPNHVYLLPPKNNMTLKDGMLRLTPHAPKPGLNLPIDIFLSSLAEDAGEHAIGVILSGTGSDGSRGIRDIHSHGGFVVVQDSHSAAFDGMPRSAAATDLADVICPPHLMPPKIAKFISQPANFPRGEYELEKAVDTDEFASLFRLFRREFGIDFSLYKPGTIQRRIERRMQLTRVDDLTSYLDRITRDVDELDALHRDLLVEVTYFFRDPNAFESLAGVAIPKLLESREEDHEIRVWVSGCATGEEAYSLAMLLHDEVSKRGDDKTIRVFASDVHQRSMDLASSGTYSEKSLEHVPASFRDKYFIESGHAFQISPAIRRLVVFARHDLTRDPPFTRIDLLSCRNVLIYLEPEIQHRILSMFHFGLRVGGILFLGSSESIGSLSKEFDTVDSHWRIYRKLRDTRLPDAAHIALRPLQSTIVRDRVPAVDSRVREDGWMLPGVYDDLLSRYVPPSLLVNEFFELIHTFGDARKLLVQPSGRTTLDLTRLVSGDLRTAIMTALHRAGQRDEPVTFRDVRAETPLGSVCMDVKVEPYNRGSRRLFLVCLEQQEQAVDPVRVGTEHDFDAEQLNRLEQLEKELDHTRQSLQTTVEQLETSNEELQSTNEELIASNEELQSTNEELHSVNEELYTVNTEHQRKIEELTALTNDLNNLLTSTDIGTIFLDGELRIRRFTPAIASAFHVNERDLGRPIEHIGYNFDSGDIMADLRRVLATGDPIEREVRSRDGQSYLKRIQTYKDESGQVDGLVMTFDDITAIQQAASLAEEAEEELALTQRELQQFAYAVSHDLQAPLRHVKYFIDELRDEGAIDTEHTSVAERLQEATERMARMVEALLAYSRVNTRGEGFVKVSLDTLMEQVLTAKQESMDACQATVTYEPLPTVMGDATQLRTLFAELLDNALKFCSSELPKIHIGVERRAGRWLLAWHDNGIGIERRHYDRIFVIFQRLGFKENAPGMGLGLALCRRILERHRGVIWVESTPTKGSTFFVQLPASPATKEQK